MPRPRAALLAALATLVSTFVFVATREHRFPVAREGLSPKNGPVSATPASVDTAHDEAEKTFSRRTRDTAPERGELAIKIAALLNSSRQLTPGQKGEEDDIRCALEQLLTDENAASIVVGLSSTDLNSSFGLTALARWAHVSPIAAGVWIAQRNETTDEQAWVLARELASDPDLRSVYVEQLNPGPWRDRFIEAAGLQIHGSPDEAIALLRQLPAGPVQTRALQSLVVDWTTSAPADATRWIDALPESPLREQLVLTAAKTGATENPLEFISWANATLRSDAVFDQALQSIVHSWAETHAEDSERFLQQLSDVAPNAPAVRRTTE